MLHMQRNIVVWKLTLSINFPTDAFAAVSILDGFVKLLFDEGKLYAQQNGIEHHTNKKKMRAFLGINYIMAFNKLPFIVNEGRRNVMATSRFDDILQYLHFGATQNIVKMTKVTKLFLLSERWFRVAVFKQSSLL